jgi:mannose-6-phosphate isomerase-like protein (cupin superfamily)
VADPDPTLTMPDGTAFRVVASTAETGGERVEIEVTLPPGAPSPPPHLHPHQDEEWRVLEGTLSVLLDDEWRTLRAGESLEVPRGHVHALRNRSDGVVRVLDIHVPAMEFEDYIRSLHRLAASGKVTGMRSPRSLVHLAMLLREHRENQVTANPLQRRAESALAAVGRRLGYSVD